MPKPPKAKVGRPTAITEDVLKKLETAFALDATDEEACFYADISPRTLYNYQADHPEFEERKKALKQRPVLVARQTVVNGLAKDPKLAMDYLKAKKRDEFATRTEVDATLTDNREIDLLRQIIDAQSLQPLPPEQPAGLALPQPAADL